MASVSVDIMSVGLQARMRRSLSMLCGDLCAFYPTVCVIFSRILSNLHTDSVWLFTDEAVIIVANAFVGIWLAGRGRVWASIPRQFGVMATINLGLSLSWIALVSKNQDGEHVIRVLIFFTLLLTLIVTLCDRYRPFNEWRFNAARSMQM